MTTTIYRIHDHESLRTTTHAETAEAYSRRGYTVTAVTRQ